MLAATLSFPCYAKPRRLTIRNSVTNFSNCNSLKLRASLSDYPLASRIMVRNLPYSTSESSLRQEFSNFGEIAEVKLEKNGARKWSKGYAFIQYTCQEDAMLALENMDYKNFDGRVIYVELAKPGAMPLEDAQEPLDPQRCSICRSKRRCQIAGTNQFVLD